MNLIKNKKIFLLLLSILLINSSSLQALAWYWFCGWMTIQGDPNLTYYLYAWDSNQKKMVLNPTPLPMNQTFLLQNLFGGVDNCQAMSWNQVSTDQNGNPVMGGTTFLLVPKKPYIGVGNPTQQELQQFEDCMKGANIAPYIYVERVFNLINVYIIGPRIISNLQGQKISFNMAAFENNWGHDPQWPGYDMAFAFSFDDQGNFLNSNLTSMSPDSFYIYGIINKSWKMGWSWNQQNPQNQYCCAGLTMDALISQGIITYQRPLLDPNDLQRVVNWINKTGQAKIADITTPIPSYCP